MKTVQALLISTLALLIAAPAARAQLKVGTVDMNKIFSAYYKTKDAEARINEARQTAKSELDERMESLKKLVDSVNQLNEEIRNPALSAEKKSEKEKARDAKIAEARALDNEIGQFRQTRERQLQQQAVRMRNGIVEEIRGLLDTKVKAEAYDLILDRSGMSLNGVPVILWAKDTFDFSDALITQLNKDKPAEPPAAPAAEQPKK